MEKHTARKRIRENLNTDYWVIEEFSEEEFEIKPENGRNDQIIVNWSNIIEIGEKEPSQTMIKTHSGIILLTDEGEIHLIC